MHSFSRWLVASCAAASSLVIIACSSDSASPAAADAGDDAAHVDAGKEAGCLFGCANADSGSDADAGDGSLNCTQMKTRIDQLGTAARACSPIQTQQCTGTTNGICCPISVSPGNTSAVNDYDHAVMVFKASCPFDCSMAMCSMNIPSNACDAPMGAMTGICQ